MKRTYLAQTAGGILKTATIKETKSGLKEIFVTGKDGLIYIADITSNCFNDCDNGNLVLRSAYAEAIYLITSRSARFKLEALIEARDAA